MNGMNALDVSINFISNLTGMLDDSQLKIDKLTTNFDTVISKVFRGLTSNSGLVSRQFRNLNNIFTLFTRENYNLNKAIKIRNKDQNLIKDNNLIDDMFEMFGDINKELIDKNKLHKTQNQLLDNDLNTATSFGRVLESNNKIIEHGIKDVIKLGVSLQFLKMSLNFMVDSWRKITRSVLEADKATANFVTSNYRLYDTQYGLVQTSRELSAATGMAADKSIETVKALSDLATPKLQMKQLGDSILRANQYLGIAISDLADFSRENRFAGGDINSFNRIIGYSSDAMKKYGLTTGDVQNTLKATKVTSTDLAIIFGKMININGKQVSSLEAYKKAQLSVAGAAKQLGYDASVAAQAVDNMVGDARSRLALIDLGERMGIALKTPYDYIYGMPALLEQAVNQTGRSLDQLLAPKDGTEGAQAQKFMEDFAQQFNLTKDQLRLNLELADSARKAGKNVRDIAQMKTFFEAKKDGVDPFNESLNTLTGQLGLVVNKIKAFADMANSFIGEGMMKWFKTITPIINIFTNNLHDAIVTVRDLMKDNPKLASALKMTAAAFLFFLPTLPAIKAFKMLNSGISSLLPNLKFLKTGITALIPKFSLFNTGILNTVKNSQILSPIIKSLTDRLLALWFRFATFGVVFKDVNAAFVLMKMRMFDIVRSFTSLSGIIKIIKTPFAQLGNIFRFLFITIGRISTSLVNLSGITALLSNPIGWAVIVVTALVAALYLAYQRSEKVRNAMDGMWQSLKKLMPSLEQVKILFIGIYTVMKAVAKFAFAVSAPFILIGYVIYKALKVVFDYVVWFVGETLVAFYEMGTGVVDAYNMIKNTQFGRFFRDLGLIVKACFDIIMPYIEWWSNVSFTEILDLMTDAINYVPTILKNGLNNIWNIISDMGLSILNGFRSIFGISSPSKKMMEIGTAIIQGLLYGILSMGTSLYNNIKTFIYDNTIGAVKQALGISSPSKVMADIATNIMQSFVDNIQNYTGLGIVYSFFEGIAGAIGSLFGKTDAEKAAENVEALTGLIVPVKFGEDYYNLMTNISEGSKLVIDTKSIEEFGKASKMLVANLFSLNLVPVPTRFGTKYYNLMLDMYNGSTLLEKSIAMMITSFEQLSAIPEKITAIDFANIGNLLKSGLAQMDVSEDVGIVINPISKLTATMQSFSRTFQSISNSAYDSLKSLGPEIRGVLDKGLGKVAAETISKVQLTTNTERSEEARNREPITLKNVVEKLEVIRTENKSIGERMLGILDEQLAEMRNRQHFTTNYNNWVS